MKSSINPLNFYFLVNLQKLVLRLTRYLAPLQKDNYLSIGAKFFYDFIYDVPHVIYTYF